MATKTTRTGRRIWGECEVCEENRMVQTESFRHGGVKKKVRVCRTCAEGGREIEASEGVR
jgi:hypothetical protein